MRFNYQEYDSTRLAMIRFNDFYDGSAVNSMFGLYYSPTDKIIIKTGAGPGLTKKADDRLFTVQVLYGL